jgi:hypothetical protein
MQSNRSLKVGIRRHIKMSVSVTGKTNCCLLLEKQCLKLYETNKLEIIDSFLWSRFFASLPAGYIHNAMFVLENSENYLLNIDFSSVKNRNRIAFKIMKARR